MVVADLELALDKHDRQMCMFCVRPGIPVGSSTEKFQEAPCLLRVPKGKGTDNFHDAGLRDAGLQDAFL